MSRQEQLKNAELKIERTATFGKHLAELLCLQPNTDGRYQTLAGPKTATGLANLIKDQGMRLDIYIKQGRF